jgi:Protein of unknown function (DUF3761)/Bacterial SH3 domain
MNTSRLTALVGLFLSFQLSACVPTTNVNSPAYQSSTAPSSNTNKATDFEQTIAVVKSTKANIRDTPSKSGAVVGQVKRDERLTLISGAPVGGWYNVRPANGSAGWVHGNVIVLNHPNSEAKSLPQQHSTQETPPSTYGRSYINVDGQRIPSPVFSNRPPAGAAARCGDGSYSFSQHRRGTCSHHGGVAEWL